MKLKDILNEHRTLTTAELLAIPKTKRHIYLLIDKYVTILNDIKKPYFTENSFEYWWNKTAISDKDKEEVKAGLKIKGLIQPNNKKEISEGVYDEVLAGLNDNQQLRVRGLVNNIIEKVRREYRTMKDAEVEATNTLLSKFFNGEMF